jgi:pimeloyl-ACP methyl ester carboxylesterase
VVALAPGGFWEGWERTYLHATLGAAIRLVRLAQPLLPAITANDLSRAILFAQFSAHPGQLPAALALDEAQSIAACASFDPLLADLAGGPLQEGAAPGAIQAPMALVWGRQDRVTLPAQAERANQAFPDAQLHWLEDCGHYSIWDQPDETLRLIFATIAPEEARDGRRHLPAAGHA